MHSVDGMHKQRGSAGRTQGGCDLARNDAALAHARDYNPAGADINHLDRLIERRRHWTRNAVGQSTQSFSLDPNNVFANVLHGKKTDVSTRKSALSIQHSAFSHAAFCRDRKEPQGAESWELMADS